MASNAQSLAQPLSGGYDCKFVEEPSSDLKCLICMCVARDPLQHGDGGCGKIFCGNCITEYQKKNNKCPNCREDIVTFRDMRSERDIQSLKVKCENEGDGCEWVGELRSLEDHLKICGYVKLDCPNKCYLLYLMNEKTNKVFRKDLQKHLEEECLNRQYTCPHCNKTGEYHHIAGFFHQMICPKMKITCQNEQCKTSFFREDKQSHLSTCLYENVVCKYKEFGCQVTPLRKDLPAHEEDDKAHLHMTMDTVLALRKQLEEQRTETSELKKKDTELQSQMLSNYLRMNQNHPTQPAASFSFKMTNFFEKQKKNITYYSPPFLTHPQGYKMIIRIDANGYGKHEGTHVSVWVFLMREEYDDELEFPFKGTITFELLNQLEDSNQHRGSYTHDGTQDSSKRVIGQERAFLASGVPAFIPHTGLGYNTAKNYQYLKDDCLVFRIYAKIPSYKPWLQCTA